MQEDLELKIGNITKCLKWHVAALLKKDEFTCQMSHTSRQDTRYHAKTFNDICKENNVSTIEQALACREL